MRPEDKFLYGVGIFLGGMLVGVILVAKLVGMEPIIKVMTSVKEYNYWLGYSDCMKGFPPSLNKGKDLK